MDGSFHYVLLREFQTHHYVKSIQIQSFFWSVLSHIWTEYGEIRSILEFSGKFPGSIWEYSVRTRENTDQKKLRIWTLFHAGDLMKRNFGIYRQQAGGNFKLPVDQVLRSLYLQRLKLLMKLSKDSL